VLEYEISGTQILIGLEYSGCNYTISFMSHKVYVTTTMWANKLLLVWVFDGYWYWILTTNSKWNY